MSAPPGPARLWTWWLAVGVGVALLWLVGAAGVSAAVPPIGDWWGPPFSLGTDPSSGLVTVTLWAAYLTGAAAVLIGWRAVGTGARVPRRAAWRASLLVALSSLLVAPQGSADHLSYVAYGRIAALGGNPYVVEPAVWAGGSDPVVSGVQPPWEDTVSVYGPVGTALQAGVAWLGNGILHATVWWWQVLTALAYLAVVGLMLRLTRETPETSSRAIIGVALNPVLVGVIVFGAHIDVLAIALLLAAVAATRSHPVWAGAAAGAAMSVKLPYGVAGLGVLAGVLAVHGSRQRGKNPAIPLAWVALGAALVVVPTHIVAGPHVYDQARSASGFTSLATPWRALANAVSLMGDGWRAALLMAVPLVVVAFAVLIWRWITVTSPPPSAPSAPSTMDPAYEIALRVVLIVGGAWTLAAPYVLPWYDILLWVPAALIGARAPVLARLLLLRTTTLALAYVPGRVTGMSPLVEDVTLGMRTYVAPAVLTAALVVLVWATCRLGRAPSRSSPATS